MNLAYWYPKYIIRVLTNFRPSAPGGLVIRPDSTKSPIVPAEHTRWIGESILGPEYADHHAPLVAIGDLSVSERMKEIPDGISLYI
jgi:hypothetical protein